MKETSEHEVHALLDHFGHLALKMETTECGPKSSCIETMFMLNTEEIS